MIEAKVDNLDGVIEALRKFGKEAAKSGGPVKNALRKAALVIRDEAIQRAPEDSGALKKNIVAQRDSKPGRSGAAERFRVGVKGGAKQYANTTKNQRAGRVGQEYKTGGSTFYWRFLEFGTEKRAPRPFLAPAFNAKAQEAIDTFAREVWKGIELVAKRVARNR